MRITPDTYVETLQCDLCPDRAEVNIPGDFPVDWMQLANGKTFLEGEDTPNGREQVTRHVELHLCHACVVAHST